MRTEEHTHEEEVADAKRANSTATLESFKRHLRTLKTPPKRASLAVLRMWHDLKLGTDTRG